MKLEHSGQEQIPAGMDEVWAVIGDPEQIARCLPDMRSYTVKDATHVDVVVRVGVGPVRGNFTFKVELQPDRVANRMNVVISGGGLGSVVDLNAGAELTSSEGIVILSWHGTANMRGPVAAVGGRVLDAQAQKLIGQTFSNVKSAVIGAKSGA
jgi:carbon monoxide dehydrogenase subunit G